MNVLCIILQHDFIPGMAFGAGEDFCALEHLHVFRINESTGCIHHRGEIGQTAALRFGSPFGAVVVAVENHFAVIPPGVGNDLMHYGFQIECAFQFIGKIMEHIGHNGVCHGIGQADALAGTNHAEFEFVARERKGRSAVPVRVVQCQQRQTFNARVQFSAGGLGKGMAFSQFFQQAGQRIAQKDADNGGRRFVAAQTRFIAGASRRHAQQIGVFIHSLSLIHISIESIRAMPGSVEDLLAMDASAFEAFRQQAISSGVSQLADLTQDSLRQLKEAADKAPSRMAEIDTELANISTRLATISAMKPQLEEALKKAQEGYAALESGKMTAVNELTKGEITLSNTESQLAQAEEQLEAAQEQFEEARDQAYKQADLSGVLTQEMLANILMAQNFNMPAGYITENGEQYLVKVGDAFQSVEELQNTVLMHLDVDGIGDVRLSDVATVELTDNAGETYAKVNGNDGVVLSFQKQSTASTADVSGRINETIEELQAENPDLHITPLMDQGCLLYTSPLGIRFDTFLLFVLRYKKPGGANCTARLFVSYSVISLHTALA